MVWSALLIRELTFVHLYSTMSVLFSSTALSAGLSAFLPSDSAFP